MSENPNSVLAQAARSGDIGGIRSALANGAANLEEALELAADANQGLALEYLREHVLNELLDSLAWIEPGEFLMGSPEDEEGREENEGPQTLVRLTRGFWMGKTPVTQAQWRAVMGNNPSSRYSEAQYRAIVNEEPIWVDSESDRSIFPVVCVSYKDALNFCRKVSKIKKRINIPTEAQWEYACRAGTKTRFSFGNDFINIDKYAWYRENSTFGINPSAKKMPNQWGLYDMHGNVDEWCWDTYSNRLPGGFQVDYSGSIERGTHVWRGGSFSDEPKKLRSAKRTSYFDHGTTGIGFRIISETPGPA